MSNSLTPVRRPSIVPVLIPPSTEVGIGQRVLESWWNGLNPHTRRSFRAAYRQAAMFFFPGNTDAELDDRAALKGLADFFALNSKGMAYARVTDWRTHLESRGLASGSINRRLTALKSLCKRLSIAGAIPYELAIDRLPEELYRDTAGPGVVAVGTMLHDTDRGRDADVRDRSIIRLLADLALRRQELTSLDVSDVDLPQKALWILRKGKRQRVKVTLTRRAVEDLTAWLDIRGCLDLPCPDGKHPLFVPIDRHGHLRPMRLTGTGVYLIIRGRGLKAGATARPHGIRHTAAIAALQATGGSLEAVRVLLGHSGYQAAQHYLREAQGLQAQVSELISSGW